MKTQKLLVIVASVCLMAFFNVSSFAQTDDPVQPALAGSVAEALAHILAAQGYDVHLDGSSVVVATNHGELNLDMPATQEALERDEIAVSFDGMVANQTVSIDGMVANQDDSEDPNANLLLALQRLESCLAGANALYDAASLSCEFTVNPIFELLCETKAIVERLANIAQCIAQFEYLSAEAVANAGADKAVDTGTLVTLDGSGSTPPPVPGLGITTYSWVITAKPPGSMAVLSGADTANPEFTPDVDGTYTVELTYIFLVDSDTDSVDVVATTP